jgi:predicted RNase H-like HicB family nuclease
MANCVNDMIEEPSTIVPQANSRRKKMAKKMHLPFVLRCMAYPRKGRYIAECVDLNLIVRGNTLEEAQAKLKSAMAGYFDAVFADLTPEQVENGALKGLLPRRSPWSRLAIYHCFCLLAAFWSARRAFRICDCDARECFVG